MWFHFGLDFLQRSPCPPRSCYDYFPFLEQKKSLWATRQAQSSMDPQGPERVQHGDPSVGDARGLVLAVRAAQLWWPCLCPQRFHLL